jgi:hypothetical protein
MRARADAGDAAIMAIVRFASIRLLILLLLLLVFIILLLIIILLVRFWLRPPIEQDCEQEQDYEVD